MHPFINTAVKAARKAGDIINRGFARQDLVKISKKGLKDYVTDIDKSAEAAIIDELRYAYPSHGILSEECEQIDGTEDYQWIIDPLDGTLNFIHNYEHVCISIAVKSKDRIEHGVIYDPIRNDLFIASRGEGTQLNSRKVRVSTTYQLAESLLATNTPANLLESFVNPYFDSFAQISKACLTVRRSGSAALDMAYVSAGKLDGYWGPGLKTWDMAAGSLMIQEAGGIISDLTGGTAFLESGNMVAANPKLFKELVKILRNYFK